MAAPFKYMVPLSREITIGKIKMGGNLPVVVQSMTNTDTNDIDASIQQCIRIIEAGGEMVRLTTQGKKEVGNIGKIISELEHNQNSVPIIADVHFNAAVAEYAAAVCHKVRINPGNYTEKKATENDYSDNDFEAGNQLNKKALCLLIQVCKKHSSTLRIGVNHGSLSNRIMSKYGDTSEGMVESTLEFLRVCAEEDFHNVVCSLKSSNTRIMVQSVRMLVKEMLKEDLYYPVHLGVTEAGDGLEARIKSVVGMAPLLLEGIGNTIRVSLTEPPEDEIPVAKNIRELFPLPRELPYNPFEKFPWDPFHYGKPTTKNINGIGGNKPPVVWARDNSTDGSPEPDTIVVFENNDLFIKNGGEKEKIASAENISSTSEKYILANVSSDPYLINNTKTPRVVVLDGTNTPVSQIKNWLSCYYSQEEVNPLVFHKKYDEKDPERFALLASGELGFFLIDGLIDGVWVENPHLNSAYSTRVSFLLLQASRARITATEFIACPSCGRTLFDIQSVLGKVKAATSHLTGLKIAVMGCIVNGPGEMADADYGYVGAGKGKVSLYKAGKVELRNIPAESAVEKLTDLIKNHGDWLDP